MDIHQRKNGKWCYVDYSASIGYDEYTPMAAWVGQFETRQEAVLAARLEAAESYIERIRQALGGYADSDLASLATTLKARNDALEEENVQWRNMYEAALAQELRQQERAERAELLAETLRAQVATLTTNLQKAHLEYPA